MKNSQVSLGTIYDFNKMLSKKEKTMDILDINKKLDEIVYSFNFNQTYYLMLLCHEKRDYTIFNMHTMQRTIKQLKLDLIETLFNRGNIVSITFDEQGGGWEIWIRPDDEEDCCYYLFDYTNGVVEVIDK